MTQWRIKLRCWQTVGGILRIFANLSGNTASLERFSNIKTIIALSGFNNYLPIFWFRFLVKNFSHWQLFKVQKIDDSLILKWKWIHRIKSRHNIGCLPILKQRRILISVNLGNLGNKSRKLLAKHKVFLWPSMKSLKMKLSTFLYLALY